ncbi:zinc transporter ZIP13 [Erpetoichthys calabaricus]|uniref:Zinc transporter ZIP13 n=1 Tax=Erpetoichthys calabaricus TaxID=27687 RepID=A0A8C4TGY0_ERPCA|nr:zinc transporter ZIP13 [Erpetoichthys calabaricus]XP_028650103.1 zinc transporter ZIP13 [Erpetoichthys calabaricus]
MREQKSSFYLVLLLSSFIFLLTFWPTASHRSSAKRMSHSTMLPAAASSRWWSTEEVLSFRALTDLFVWDRVEIWICSLMGSAIVGLSGVFPLLVIPIEAGATLKTEAGSQKLKRLLSFAIGGLLGDVFLHLLPEAWAYSCSGIDKGQNHSQQDHKTLGLWVIGGLMTFLTLEKMFPDRDQESEDSERITHKATSSSLVHENKLGNGMYPRTAVRHNGVCDSSALKVKNMNLQQPAIKIKTSGYLNLLANCIDNFTHGLAVAGSFLVSRKVGFLTTFAILLHEIPHEVGDFAILLRAGFDRWSAAKMQLSTAFGGLLGACFALCAQSPKGAENSTAWILPFTSGGFLYIALVNVVPELLEEANPRSSLQQVLLMCSGIAVMILMSAVVE